MVSAWRRRLQNSAASRAISDKVCRQTFAGPRQTRANRADGQIKNRGSLFIGQAFHGHADQDLAPIIGKAEQGGVQRLYPPPHFQIGQRVAFIGQLGQCLFRDIGVPKLRAAPQMGPHHIDGNAEQPSRGQGPALEAFEAPKGLKKRLLGQIFGIGAVAHLFQDEAKQPLLVG
ncbi:hypothetical protein A6A05_15860 [Magnetospirillum moscoviense]|uniref:Uncharacterized protein n=1 Tax=Magnetospirillum moscoviense TaxID=1437059 RepID=A0A178MEC7_9PROT|nr:hypothetical protein A6A05_15860 [Magnetospirillum moscoviense]